LAACGSRESSSNSASGSSSGAVSSRETTLPTGVVIRLRSQTALSTRSNHTGDAVRASAVSAGLSEHGDTIIPAAAEFTGSVTAIAAGKPNKPGTLQVAFTEVRWGGRSYPVHARV